MEMNGIKMVIPIVDKEKIDKPEGYALVIYEKGQDAYEGMIIFNWEELNLYDIYYKDPRYAYIKMVEI